MEKLEAQGPWKELPQELGLAGVGGAGGKQAPGRVAVMVLQCWQKGQRPAGWKGGTWGRSREMSICNLGQTGAQHIPWVSWLEVAQSWPHLALCWKQGRAREGLP